MSADADIADGEITQADAMMAEARTALSADLARIAADPARRVFAVFDGAQSDDIDAALTEAKLAHRSLYINVDDQALVDAGPWLVDFYADAPEPDPTEEEQAALPEEEPLADDALSDEALQAEADGLAAEMKAALEAGDETGGGELSLESDEAPAMPDPDSVAARIEAATALLENCPNVAVFWIGDESLTEEAMWKHTRSINRVMIPREFAGETWEEPSEDTEAHETDDTTHTDVMFRHADGNVLAEVMPVLDSAQFARLFGPAKAFTFLAPDHPSQSSGSALRRAVLPDDAPKPTAGFLRLSDVQLVQIEDARREVSRQRIKRFLQKHVPPQLSELTDDDLDQIIAQSRPVSDSLGIKTERGHARWAYLMMLSGGQAAETREATDFVREGPNPDQKVKELIDHTAQAIRNGNEQV